MIFQSDTCQVSYRLLLALFNRVHPFLKTRRLQSVEFARNYQQQTLSVSGEMFFTRVIDPTSVYFERLHDVTA